MSRFLKYKCLGICRQRYIQSSLLLLLLLLPLCGGTWHPIQGGSSFKKADTSFLYDGQPDSEASIAGEMKQWHTINLMLEGPETSELAVNNPFLNYRIEAEFYHPATDTTIHDIGFYDADGRAAESSASSGNIWTVRWVPPLPGEWIYTIEAKTGPQAALGDGGTALEIDGMTGVIDVSPTDKSGKDFRGKGWLNYVGEHFYRFESGEYFLKGGVDSPENLLAYADFDGTEPTHRFRPHLDDFRGNEWDLWKNGKGQGLLGMINYLSEQGVNSIYFLTMNVEGDTDDVWPWVSKTDYTRFDVSKLAQWEKVFQYAGRYGVALHMVHQENENDQLLDGGELGVNRKLYYRELTARFGHHLALIVNLGEENTNTISQLLSYSNYLKGIFERDNFPIQLHTFPWEWQEIAEAFFPKDALTGFGLQGGISGTCGKTNVLREGSAAAGRPWVITSDEQSPAEIGMPTDSDPEGQRLVIKRALWGNLMCGGAGAEWYFGYDTGCTDTNCEDMRTRENAFRMTKIALDFYQEHLPFSLMEPCAEGVVDKPNRVKLCSALAGNTYAGWYRGVQSSGYNEILLALLQGIYQIFWLDPYNGGPLQVGDTVTANGDLVDIGLPQFNGEAVFVAKRLF